ncbi:2-phospho-L-lactate guanylyltransferase [Thermobifida halotolerans]|uniref:2-phospho-L-lactate guanylyltransferase n=1 Tax=Thermobifida halotolerans TaxID=483545 RepID=UPI000838AF4F
MKRLAAAKSRLAGFAGARRGELALALACDTVRVAVATPGVRAVFAVTEDETAAPVLGRLGAHVVTGEPGTGLNAALTHGAHRARLEVPGAGVCALSADLPALRAAELARVLAAAAAHPNAFLADAVGVGTTLYSAAPDAVFAPAFEGWSRLRHRERGAVEIELDGVPTVRRDVDTPDDLRAAAELGVGPHTAVLLADLGVAPVGG